MTTPRAVAGRFERAGDLRRQRLQRQAERAAAARPASSSPSRLAVVVAAAELLGELFLGRALADRDRDRLALAVADELERDARADRRVGDEVD